MLGEKELQVVRVLARQSHPMTARSLAAELNVSIRSIKTYVQRINHEAPHAVQSGQNGYRIDPDVARALLGTDIQTEGVPQTNDGRASYVLHRLLAADDPLDVFDLCEHLFVSYSTIKQVVSSVRSRLAPFHLGLKQERNKLILTGRERDRRHALSDLLYTEATVNFLDLKTIQSAFPTIDIPYIEACVQSALNDNQSFANDYSMINLVLHIAITIDRLRGNNVLEHTDDNPSARQTVDVAATTDHFIPALTLQSDGTPAGLGPLEMNVARTIAHKLEEHFDVTFDATEVAELALLLASRTTMLDYRTASPENIEQVVGKPCLDVVNEMIADLRENAGINLSEHEFYVRFALHIKNLIVRARMGGLSKNPLTDQIKTNCPLLYDTAVMEADLLQRRAHITINDDEIAYIAFHLGSTLETQKQLTNKVKAVLYCPSYYNIDAKILLFLNRHFENDLLVTNVVTDESDLEHLQGAELLIVTVPVNAYYALPTYQISIIPTDSDRSHLRELVEMVQKQKRRAALRSHLETLIEPQLFMVNPGLTDRDQVISLMANRLYESGHVTEDFESRVHEREKLSSTVYGSVAIPHALRQASLHSSISVMTSKSPIAWGEGRVTLVVMLSFSKSDQEVFYEIFDPLVSILANREQADMLANTEDYEEFIALLCDMME